MARLVQCRDCGNAISKKATKCPVCGRPSKTPRRQYGWFSVIVGLLIVGWLFPRLFRSEGWRDRVERANLSQTHDPVAPLVPASARPTQGADDHRFPVGSVVILRNADPQKSGVWVVKALADYGEFAEAERQIDTRSGPHPGAKRTRMAEAGRIRIVWNGQPAKVIESSPGYRKVDAEDEFNGQPITTTGWVRADDIEPSP